RYRLIGDALRAVGIDVNCAPVLDLLRPETHSIIAGRSYGADPAEVAVIGRAVADGLMAGGVAPVMKHIPGHGRPTADSHEHLPRVSVGQAELAVDFAPFRALTDLPVAIRPRVVVDDIETSRPGALAQPAGATMRG